jgi:hypothetical protein
MISHVRIKAFGPTIADVDKDLREAAHHIRPLLRQPVYEGDYVIQRDNANAIAGESSRDEFEGRLILHPNVAK